MEVKYQVSDQFLSQYEFTMVHCCKSAKESDLQGEKLCRGDGNEVRLLWEALDPGCRGGRCGGDFEVDDESSLALLMLSELLMATAKANVLLLLLIGLFAIPLR